MFVRFMKTLKVICSASDCSYEVTAKGCRDLKTRTLYCCAECWRIDLEKQKRDYLKESFAQIGHEEN